MTKKSLFLFVLQMTILSTQSFAKDLIVSDIDDTLKISHVTDTIDSVQNALTKDRPFLGMANLLSEIKKQNPDAELVYLSNAPSVLLESSHTAFLVQNHFPKGQIRLRGSASSAVHKILQLRDLIKTLKPGKMLLIGDNGERDPIVYEQIQKEYPQIEMTILIHQVGNPSGLKLKMGQIGFVTAIDAALSLASMATNISSLGRWLNLNQLNFLSAEIESFLAEPDQVGDSGAAYIPDWMDCTDYQQSFSVPFDFTVELYKAKLPIRCAHVDSELLR